MAQADWKDIAGGILSTLEYLFTCRDCRECLCPVAAKPGMDMEPWAGTSLPLWESE